jgi:hypothetical protein
MFIFELPQFEPKKNKFPNYSNLNDFLSQGE